MGTGSGLNFSTTPSMGLSQPVPAVCGAFGVEPPGKSWLELINSSLGTIDGHTHAPGFGSPIPSAALAINADVSWAGFNLTGLRSARFGALALGSLGASDVGCLVVSGLDLYFVDGAGNQVRLTSAGNIAGTPGSITGLGSPAAVTYTSAAKLFAFTSSSGFAANLSCGPVSIGDATLSAGKSVTISVPPSLAANYSMSLPTTLPGAKSFLSLDNAGAIAAGPLFTGGLTTTHLAAGAGILGSQLSGAAGILGSQLALNTVDRTRLAALGQQVSSSCGGFTATPGATPVDVTNLTVTITTTGRPVVLFMQPDGTTSFPGSSWGPTSLNGTARLHLLRAATILGIWEVTTNNGVTTLESAGSQFLLDPVAAGTYTYKIQASSTVGTSMQVTQWKLVAYEL